MILVKLGGSVITHKDSLLTARKDVIQRLCKEIADSGKEVLIVCGAGSYGHIKADKYRLQKGRDESIPGQLEAVAEVQRDVRQLNMLVLGKLMAAGLKPASVPPASCLINSKGKIHRMHTEVFRWFSDLGMTCVTFGDVVPDSEIGFSICSGDWLMYRLAGDLQIKEAVFATNLDGVFTADPGVDPRAELIREVTAIRNGSIDLKGRDKPDVTGGMGGKVRVGLEMTVLGVTTRIINGNVEGRLTQALEGEEIPCTLIRRV